MIEWTRALAQRESPDIVEPMFLTVKGTPLARSPIGMSGTTKQNNASEHSGARSGTKDPSVCAVDWRF
jgi:hypothetical protein